MRWENDGAAVFVTYTWLDGSQGCISSGTIIKFFFLHLFSVHTFQN